MSHKEILQLHENRNFKRPQVYATIIVSSRKSSNDAIYYQTVAKSHNFTGVVDSQTVMELSFHNSRDLFLMHLTALSTSMKHTWHGTSKQQRMNE